MNVPRGSFIRPDTTGFYIAYPWEPHTGERPMSFCSWCLCHADDARRRLNALEQTILRRRLIRDAQVGYERMLARWESQVTAGIQRDIRDWRTEL